MCNHRSNLALAVVVVVVCAPVAARANCPAVPNGTFDTNITGWTNFGVWDGTLGDPPGSDQVGPVTAGGLTTYGDALSTCLLVTPGDRCNLTAEAYVPVGQPTSGSGQLGYIYFSDAGCSTPLSLSATADLTGTTQGTWLPLSTGPLTVPPGASSAKVALNVGAAPNTSMTINWDNVVSADLSPVPMLDPRGLLLLGAVLAVAGALVLRGVRA